MTEPLAHPVASSYRRHVLHDPERDWPETNCYVDLWIEVLSARGLEPTAGLGFTVTQDFEGDQFTFFKFPQRDLEVLFGASVGELAIYDDLVTHVETQVARGRLPLVEMDSFFLPDTRGVSYRREHSKTTIAIDRIDRERRQLGYFHNAGYFELAGEDFDGVFQRLPEQQGRSDALPPYVEFVKFAQVAPSPGLADVVAILEEHMARRPSRNPIGAYRQHFDEHSARLARADAAYFHKYAFNVLRQLGANHELLSAHLEWLRKAGIEGLDRAIQRTRQISAGAKVLQFQMLRASSRGKVVDAAPLAQLATAYDEAFSDLAASLAATRASRMQHRAT